MIRSVSQRRSVVALVAALAILAGGIPAGAVVDTSLSCPGSIESAGFGDVESFDDATQRSIDCIATHGMRVRFWWC